VLTLLRILHKYYDSLKWCLLDFGAKSKLKSKFREGRKAAVKNPICFYICDDFILNGRKFVIQIPERSKH